VVRGLAGPELAGVEVLTLRDPLDLVDLTDAQALIVIDACRSGAEPGSVHRLSWQELAPDSPGGASSHGFGVAGALTLVAALGRPLPDMVLFGVEVKACEPGAELSEPVKQALPELARQVLAEVRRRRGGQGGGIP
jgi:hydrogenase maturation protease